MQAFATPPEAFNPELCGREARRLIDEHLSGSGAVLIKGLPISKPEQCKDFVHGMGFRPASYQPVGNKRDKVCCAAKFSL